MVQLALVSIIQKAEDNLDILTQSLTVTNVTSLPLNAKFKIKSPFHMVDEDGDMKYKMVRDTE